MNPCSRACATRKECPHDPSPAAARPRRDVGHPCPCPAGIACAEAPPNIVIFLADDLGIGEIEPWGQTEVLTPSIDRLARDGMKLTEVRSNAAACGPARCSLMTALHNGHCRLHDNDNDYLRPADLTLAERLKARGYADGGYETTDLGPYADRPSPMAKKSYAAQVRRLDQDLGHLRALLDSLGIALRTLIIFLSDNGATFLRCAEHDGTNVIGHWFNGTLNYRGFKGDLYEGGFRVPGIAAWPGRVKPGGTSAVRADFTDVHATIVEAAGLPAPKNIDGRSILPVLVGKGAVKTRDYFVWFSSDRNQSAVLFGRMEGGLNARRAAPVQRDVRSGRDEGPVAAGAGCRAAAHRNPRSRRQARRPSTPSQKAVVTAVLRRSPPYSLAPRVPCQESSAGSPWQ